ncbi:MAG: SDR family oxidoreductase [Pseudomonadota bacterium]|nr:SDR family oxidoreductase [Pseudomonadota bacterium]
MSGRLDRKIVVITGAARGLGAVYAKAYAGEGAKVCVSDILNPGDTVKEIVDEGGEALGLTADVTNLKECVDMAGKVVEVYGGIDILVNNAALFVDLPRRTFLDIGTEEWEQVMSVNVRGSFNCAKAVTPHMRKRGSGVILNIASSTALKGIPFTLHYVTSKGAIIAMTRALARELGDDQIRVNALAPGLTMSEAVVKADKTFAPYNEASIRGRAIKREQIPDDLIGAAIFLASDESAFVTGQTFVVDGGDIVY